MIIKEQVIEIIKGGLSEGQFIVDVVVNPGNKIIVTVDDFKGISLDSCAEMSRIIESSLDRDKEDYELEVTSPGLLSPFKVPQQYQKNIGKEIEILLKSGEKMKGTLISFENEKISIEIEELVKEQGTKKKTKRNTEITLDTVKQTKLVLTF